jgi:hypothetical protein
MTCKWFWRYCKSCLLIFCFLMTLFPRPAQTASWSVFAIGPDDSPMCEFDKPINDFLSSRAYFSRLNKDCNYDLKIVGTLVPEDVTVLRRIVSFLKSNPTVKRPLEIMLNSPGGSVTAGLAIATEIRNPKSPLFKLGSTVVSKEKCYSSCVFIIAASFQKHVFGDIGIHRPRFVEQEYTTMGYGSLQKAYQGLYITLKDFFSAANIHPSLIDDMWSIPSNDIRILSEADLSKYRLNKDDMVMEEEGFLRIVEVCGENGPRLEKQFMKDLMAKCADRTGKISSDCFEALLKIHPYRECYRKLNR